MIDDKKCICGQTSNDDGTCDGSHEYSCSDDAQDLNEDVPFGD